MWSVGRRSALFIVSYMPLAAIFLAQKWPEGWEGTDLLRLAVGVLSVAALAFVPFAIPVITGRLGQVSVALLVLAAIAGLVAAVRYDWFEPAGLHASKPQTAATAAAVAFGFLVFGALLLAALLYNTRRAGEVHWRVADPRDHGAAIAGYLATYILPFVTTIGSGWRITVAYVIYLLTLYVVYVRSDSLVLVNPTLYLFGYRIYDVATEAQTDETPGRALLLTKLRISQATDVVITPLGDNGYFARGVQGGGLEGDEADR